MSVLQTSNFFQSLYDKFQRGLYLNDKFEESKVDVRLLKFGKFIGALPQYSINRIVLSVLEKSKELVNNFDDRGETANIEIASEEELKYAWKVLAFLEKKSSVSIENKGTLQIYRAHCSDLFNRIKAYELAAKRCQARWKAKIEAERTRRYFILPKNIELLRKELSNYRFLDTEGKVYEFCRFLSQMMKIYYERGVKYRFDRHKSYRILDVNYDCFGVDFWFQLDKERHEVFLYFKLPVKLGGGGFKDVFASKTFTISMPYHNGLTRVVTYQPTGFAQIVSGKKSLQKDVLRGLKVQKQLIQQLSNARNIAVLPLFKGDHNNRLELIFPWYNGDFFTVNNSLRGAPLDIDKTSYKILTLEDKMNVLIDIGMVLAKMHKMALVHRDVKATNVLVRYEGDNLWSGHLNDFDLIEEFGKCSNARKYCYWDLASQEGWAIPTSDAYGLLMCMGEAFFGKEFLDNFVFHREKFKETSYFTMLERIVSKKVKNEIESLGVQMERESYNTDCPSKIDLELQYVVDVLRKCDLTQEQRQGLNRLKKEIRILEINHNFIRECIERDKQLYKILTQDLSLQRKLVYSDVQQKLVGAEILYDIFPSVEQLMQRCISIRDILRAE